MMHPACLQKRILKRMWSYFRSHESILFTFIFAVLWHKRECYQISMYLVCIGYYKNEKINSLHMNVLEMILYCLKPSYSLVEILCDEVCSRSKPIFILSATFVALSDWCPSWSLSDSSELSSILAFLFQCWAKQKSRDFIVSI